MSRDPAFLAARPWCRLDGELNTDLQTALLACEAGGREGEPAHAELRALNWGGRDGADAHFLFGALKPGQTLALGFGDDEVFSGDISAIEERYGDGAPQLLLLAEDALQRLARTRASASHAELSPADLVQRIATTAGLQGDCNLDAPTATFNQLNESDLSFLLRVLGRYGVLPRVDGRRLLARTPESTGTPIEVDLMQGGRGRLIADLAQQPTQVDVRGYNLASGEAVHGSRSDAPAHSAAARLGALNWNAVEDFPQPFAGSQHDADGFAAAALRRRAERYVHGTLELAGDPRLRAGVDIELSGVSPNFAGQYRIGGAWHRFDTASGYRTQLQLYRGDWHGA